MEVIDRCPICSSTEATHFLSCKDFTVSKETFNLVSCSSCGFVFTNPRPDEKSISRYYQSEDYISHQNKSNSLINVLYKIVRNYTLKNKVKLINQLHSRDSILDYGCGTGYFLKACQTDGWNVDGIEPDEGANKIASNILGKNVYQATSQLSDKKFTVITLWHVLEHIHSLNETMQFLYQHLKENGWLVVAVPNHTSYDGRHYKEYWAGYDVPRHLYHFVPKTIKKLAEKHKLKVEKILPMKFDSFYVSMLSEKYKGNNINLIKPFINGCKSNIYAKKSNNYSSLIYILSK